ncbi:MAG: hypothetical protein PHI19_01375 [Clostridia bacterium]|nr:hypothetical protein [Clostridia bacterium]
MAKSKNRGVPPQLQSFQPEVTPETIKKASVRPLSTGVGPVPVAPVAQNVQLTPIVQPLAFVPYSTQKQPLFMFDDEADPAIVPEAVPQEPVPVTIENEACEPSDAVTKPRKGIKAAPVILILLSLLVAAVFVVGKYVSVAADYTYFYALEGINHNGIDIVISVYEAIAAGEIIALEYALPSAIALTGVFAVLTFLASLIRICKKGACVFAKITTAFTFLFALLAIILALVEEATMGYGLYIAGGLALLSILVAYLSRSR